jgi:Uma2 family endonuclease
MNVPDRLDEGAEIPGWVVDLDSFRRWARSDDFPRRGRFSYLAGDLWVDLSKEPLFTHNQAKTRITSALAKAGKAEALGYLFTDRALWTNRDAGLSTEPDALFCSFDAIQTNRVRFAKGVNEGFVELEGTPDMVLEVVSATSVKKDTQVLRELYARAGVAEYWLVDARETPARFEILHRTGDTYGATPAEPDGWSASTVFGRAFRFRQDADPLGHPRYTLESRP